MTTELKVMVGVPGSGKSTWIEQEVTRLEDDHRTTCVVSRDFVRKSLLNDRDGYFDKETEVFNEFVRQINEAMELGIDVVLLMQRISVLLLELSCLVDWQQIRTLS